MDGRNWIQVVQSCMVGGRKKKAHTGRTQQETTSHQKAKGRLRVGQKKTSWRIAGEIIIMIVWSGVGRPGRRRRRRRREEIDSGLPTSSPTYINSSSVAPESLQPCVAFRSRTGFSEMKHNQVHKKVVFDLVAGACSALVFFARLSRFCE